MNRSIVLLYCICGSKMGKTMNKKDNINDDHINSYTDLTVCLLSTRL